MKVSCVGKYIAFWGWETEDRHIYIQQPRKSESPDTQLSFLPFYLHTSQTQVQRRTLGSSSQFNVHLAPPYFSNSSFSFGELGSVRVKAMKRASPSAAPWRNLWMSENSANHLWLSTSSRTGRLCLLFSRSPVPKWLVTYYIMYLTFAELLALIWNLLPWVEGEVGWLVNCLARNLSVIFVIEGQHSAQEKVDDDSETPEIDLLSIGFLQKDFWRHIRLVG